MKKALIIAFFVLIFVPLAAFGADIDIKFKGIGVGSTYAAVVKQLGKPLKTQQDSRNECVGEDEMYLEYDGVKLYLLGNKKTRKFVVSSIGVTVPAATLTPAIKIGMTPKQIQAKFGKPDMKDEEDGAERWFYENQKYVGYTTFIFKNGKLIGIGQSEMVC